MPLVAADPSPSELITRLYEKLHAARTSILAETRAARRTLKRKRTLRKPLASVPLASVTLASVASPDGSMGAPLTPQLTAALAQVKHRYCSCWLSGSNQAALLNQHLNVSEEQAAAERTLATIEKAAQFCAQDNGTKFETTLKVRRTISCSRTHQCCSRLASKETPTLASSLGAKARHYSSRESRSCVDGGQQVREPDGTVC